MGNADRVSRDGQSSFFVLFVQHLMESKEHNFQIKMAFGGNTKIGYSATKVFSFFTLENEM